jgi:hypothetical protein
VLLDLTGQRIGRLVVDFEVEPKMVANRGKTRRRRRYRCICDCGNATVVWQSHLRSAATQSCGCLHKEVVRATMQTHGMKKMPEYRTWCAMKERCSRPKNISYKNYGAKGIKVCERWRTSFQAFFADMGAKPSPKHTIDRIDPSGNYEPTNCRWATYKEQFDNTSNPKFAENIGNAENFASRHSG